MWKRRTKPTIPSENASLNASKTYPDKRSPKTPPRKRILKNPSKKRIPLLLQVWFKYLNPPAWLANPCIHAELHGDNCAQGSQGTEPAASAEVTNFRARRPRGRHGRSGRDRSRPYIPLVQARQPRRRSRAMQPRRRRRARQPLHTCMPTSCINWLGAKYFATRWKLVCLCTASLPQLWEMNNYLNLNNCMSLTERFFYINICCYSKCLIWNV
jgi:hypothetical protein